MELGTCSAVRIATDVLPAERRLPALSDLFDRSIGMDIVGTKGQPIDLQVQSGPGLRRAFMLRPFTASAARPASRLGDGDDTVCLMLNRGGHIALNQRGRECVSKVGDGVLLMYRQPSRIRFHAATYLSLRVPFQELAMLTDVEAAAARCVPGDTPALQLLRRYVASLPERIADPDLLKLVATHVYDLMAVALGARGEARELASGRGVRAARLEAIKAELAQDPSRPIDEIANWQGVTVRYVQMLFEEQGTTFGEFVTDRRLDTAKSMLRSPRYAAWSIAGIAFEAGFRDLSHFNRRFRRRFGATPSELRRGPHERE